MSNQQKMFTLEQIKTAHSKVKSGADFPAYIQNLKKMGVTYYETFVRDGHTDYFGNNNYKVVSPAIYEKLTIVAKSNEKEFRIQLKNHQDGKTDYLTFCMDAANSGIEKWGVCIKKMTCIYFDRLNEKILVEEIPH
ncbi:DUF1398 family protein [Mariniflexile litorale]|uniref:DUF1398 family protein n=1 Tax=Mariniflexile litorale TaxID=3045158 RepID=A0AAU7EI17_9FLAO|nr:DUF1398 family protein [Mariniflexile sp. KMM 9835]MDQ8211998.1 DUF1398 family protein [Mariniflexile sp. KMM 9835]